MGNVQSTGAQNKLSKPKTNSNSTSTSPSLPPGADSPASISTQYASLSARDRHQIRAQLLSPVEPNLDGSDGSSNGDNGLGELATQVQRRLSTISRSNSLTSCFGSKHSSTTKLANASASRISLVSSTQRGVDLDTALRILREVKKNATPEDLAALQQALQPATHTSAPLPEGLTRQSSVINRSNSSLIRRRSLIATPGLATRTSPVEPSRKTWSSWKTPKLDAYEEAKWNKKMMDDSSPLAQLAALDLAEDGRNSPEPRAHTPGDMDYSHLGNLRLGSLVVTNGAASPSPSSRSNLYVSQEEDCFAASDGNSSPLMMKPTRRGDHNRSKSSDPRAMPQSRRNLHPPPGDGERASAGSNSPLRVEQRSRNSYYHPERDVTRSHLWIANNNADTLAHNYIAELPASSFATLNLAHLGDDEGFASEGARSLGEEALGILDGMAVSELPTEVHQMEPVPRASTDSSRSKPKKRRFSRRPHPKKTDSGYSSGGSFRTVDREHEGALQGGNAPTLSKKSSVAADKLKSGSGTDSEDTASLYTSEQMLRVSSSKTSLPTVPGDEYVGPARPAPLQLQATSTSFSSDTAASPKTPKSLASRSSLSSFTSTQKHLQKRCSHQESPIIQSCQPIPEGSIPEIPDQIRAQFTRRLSECPGMEYLIQTYPSKDHVTTEESVLQPFEEVQFDFTSPSTAHNTGLSELSGSEDERPPTPPPHGERRRSLSIFRRRSTARKKEGKREEENASPNVVDLGTIATALGRSPYDIAMPAVQHNAKVILSPTHPHQLGNALPRAKSMVNMDAQTAARSARMRSKDRVLLRPEMPQRPRSYHEMNLEAGEALKANAFKRRPRSFYADAPPMPSLSRHRGSIQQERGVHVSSPTTNEKASYGIHLDRYSGGLDYGYERGLGVGGSAGTRQLHSYASRKSMHYSHHFGVDLSDVPIFVQRT